MKQNNLKVNITIKDLILTIVFGISVALIVYADYFIDMSVKSNESLDETRKISQKIAEITLSIDKISLDTNILKTGFLKNVNNLPQFPLDINSGFMFGKANPFSGGFITVGTTTSSAGGIRYNSQTGSSSIIVIPPRR